MLANLFYDGKILKPEYRGTLRTVDILDENCEFLSYNPLKRNIKRKMNYLLSRPYSVVGDERVRKFVEECIEVLKKTVIQLYMKGEVWWEFEPCPKSFIRFKITVRNAESVVPKYTNEEETKFDAIGYLWNKILDNGTVARYVDFIDMKGRHRFALSGGNDLEAAEEEELGHGKRGQDMILFKSLPFVKLESDSLFEAIDILGQMYSARYYQADKMLSENAEPVGVIKNASETNPYIIKDDIQHSRMVRVEGTGDFSYVSPSQDFGSVNTFMSTLKSDIMDLCGVVSREQELSYVTSGRAIDRLYIDMDSDAAEMGSVLRNALLEFIRFVSAEIGQDLEKDFDIIFNTDKPTDEQQIISNISSSKDLLSEETLLEQHPWVKDVQKEMRRKEREKDKSRQEKQVEQEPKTPASFEEPQEPDSEEEGGLEE